MRLKLYMLSLFLTSLLRTGFGQWNADLSGNIYYSVGRVGIGTMKPRGKLDVDGPGDIYLCDDPKAGTKQAAFLPGLLSFSPYNRSNVSYIQARRSDNSGTTAFRFRTWNNGTMTESMHIEGNGNVGIGITAPAEKLHVGGNICLPVGNSIGFGTSGHFPWDGKNIGYYSLGYYNDTAVPSEPMAYLAAGGGFRFFIGATPRITITPYGNLLIDKLTQENRSYKLEVRGPIRVNSIVVNTTGADFVFQDGYPLPKLSEVENYITKNKHLPGILPATEMEKNGLDLGSMNIQLLQKMEEMTLYMIQLKKEVDLVKMENDELKRKIILNRKGAK